ncbi:hypothetical protein OIY81_1214 [Cryptosporidium canis]|nr:hypothetical protein OIY81_1214 [Cryptosporidium canis]
MPALTCAYLCDIYSRRPSSFSVDSYDETFSDQHINFEDKSVAIFDSNYNKIKQYRPDNELISHFCEKIDTLTRNNNKYNTHEELNSSRSNIGLAEESLWNGQVDVFEQSINYGECHCRLNNSYLLKKLGVKNVFQIKANQQNHQNVDNLVGLMSNSYSLKFRKEAFEKDEILEIVRHKLEGSDQNRVFNLFTEVDSVFSNVSNIIAEFLDEEAPHSYQQSLSLLVNESMYTINGNPDFESAINFANIRFLLDQSSFCENIWLADLNHIKELTNMCLNDKLCPLDILAFVASQINVTGDIDDKSVYNLGDMGRSVYHPFRNIAIFNPINTQSKVKGNFPKHETLESIFSNNFLDICQSKYFGVDALGKSEIISIMNKCNYKLGIEAEKIINYLSLNTRIIPNNYNSAFDCGGFPVSIMHSIYGLSAALNSCI